MITLTPWPDSPRECCERFLSELEPTKHPHFGTRLVKRVLQAAGAATGTPFYISERDFAEIAGQAGFCINPRIGNKVEPVRSWTIAVSRRSLRRFLARHGVQPC